MGPLPSQVYQSLLHASDIFRKYKDPVDPQSAFEILNDRIKEHEQQVEKQSDQAERSTQSRREKSTFEEVLTSPVAKQVGRELVRGVFGVLFGTTTRRSSRRRNIF
jgi:hypothetical protein